MELRLCRVALSICSPIRIIFQRMFEHVLPYRRTAQLSSREVFTTLVTFHVFQQKVVIRTFLCTRQQQFRSV